MLVHLPNHQTVEVPDRNLVYFLEIYRKCGYVVDVQGNSEDVPYEAASSAEATVIHNLEFFVKKTDRVTREIESIDFDENNVNYFKINLRK